MPKEFSCGITIVVGAGYPGPVVHRGARLLRSMLIPEVEGRLVKKLVWPVAEKPPPAPPWLRPTLSRRPGAKHLPFPYDPPR